jgi:DNA repair exonuclease SbcCD nuclease subunit
MFKFIHAADIHLDSPLHGLERYEGAPVDEIRGATRRALDNLVQLAIDEEVDFVLIAGDLYDGNWRDHNTGLYFVSRLVKLRDAGTAVYAISGNHDATSKMTKSLRLPQNPDSSQVMLSDRRAETIVLEKLGVAIHGQGFAKAVVEENVVPQFPAAQAGYFNIGLLHTSLDLEGESQHARYAPCTLGDLKGKGYQYWALGHIHQRAVRLDNPYVVFAGNVQGRHIRESGEKGCFLVSVDDRHSVTSEFRSLDVFRWQTCDVDATGAQDRDDVAELIAAELSHLVAENADLPMAVRVKIFGACSSHARLQSDLVALASDIRAVALDVGGGRVWIEKIKVETTPAQVLDERQLADGPLGELVNVIREMKVNDELLAALGKELADLERKLPDDLKTADELRTGREPILLCDPIQLRASLSEVQSLLMARLQLQEVAQ